MPKRKANSTPHHESLIEGEIERESNQPVHGTADGAAFSHDALSWCWRQIDQFPLLNPEEQDSLAARVRQGDEDAYRQMVECNLRLVVSVARRCQRYAGPSLSLSDLVQEGTIGLMKAVRKYDHERGYRFSTYATYWIRQAIMRAITDTGRMIRLPTHVAESVKRVEHTRHLLAQSLEREPDNWEVAMHIGCELEQIQALNAQNHDTTSLDTVIHEEHGVTTLEDYLEDTSASPVESALESVNRTRLSRALRHAMQELKPREAEILNLRYGLNGDQRLTLGAVANRISLTRERVRQIERQAIQKLRKNKTVSAVFQDA
jgi:RNA polymerase primary sigma factor